jgi:hypothetical protein
VNERPSAVVPLERYVDGRALAELMAVSHSTIKRWTAEGMPSETWGMARTRRYLPSKAIQWASCRDKLPSTPRGCDRNAPQGQRQAKE